MDGVSRAEVRPSPNVTRRRAKTRAAFLFGLGQRQLIPGNCTSSLTWSQREEEKKTLEYRYEGYQAVFMMPGAR